MTLNMQHARNTVWNQQTLFIVPLFSFRNYSTSLELHSSYLRCPQPHTPFVEPCGWLKRICCCCCLIPTFLLIFSELPFAFRIKSKSLILTSKVSSSATALWWIFSLAWPMLTQALLHTPNPISHPSCSFCLCTFTMLFPTWNVTVCLSDFQF